MATGRGPAARGGYASRVVLHPRKLETNATQEFAKLTSNMISQVTKITTNKSLEGGTIGTSNFRDGLHVMIQNSRFSHNESMCTY